jgi:DNA polymerase III epsilon subunit-like protein
LLSHVLNLTQSGSDTGKLLYVRDYLDEYKEYCYHTLREVIADADFLAAHNASFDQRVLESCCRTHHLPQPAHPFVCTVRLARTVWSVYPTKLPDVCRHLKIPLNHHQADSDAEACARIVMTAREAGWQRQVNDPSRKTVLGSRKNTL